MNRDSVLHCQPRRNRQGIASAVSVHGVARPIRQAGSFGSRIEP